MLSQLMRAHQGVDPAKMRAADFLKAQDQIERTKLMAIVSGSGWREVYSCPVCGSVNNRPEFSKHSIEYVCCQQCETRYTRRIAANLDDVYKSRSYLSYSKEDSDEHYNYRRERFGRERVGILESCCGDLTEKYLLDVGCGNGYFLSVAMEKCRHCYGTEFSDRLREFTQQRTGLTIYSNTLDELPEKSFDIITLFDVLEHIPEPIPFLRSVDQVLRPGGYVFIFTPNFDSFSIRVMQQYSSIVDPTEHVVLYTLPSLHFLAGRFGYEVVYEETHGLDIINILSMQQYRGESLNEFLMQWDNELQAMVDVSRCGDYGRIMFRKPRET